MIRAMARRAAIVALLGFLFSAAIPATKSSVATLLISGERRMSLNEGWRFYRGDAKGAENPEFDDSQWGTVRLPHDWAIEGPFDPTLNPHTGALLISGTGWYRKSFLLPEAAKDRFFTVVFDGAMSNTIVWLNGHELGRRPYGYASFAFDLTPYLRLGNEANVISVCLAPEEHSSRWYPGAGIYRNVWLDMTGPVHVAEWGTYVTTPEVSDEKATVAVKTEVRNRRNKDAEVVLRTSALDESGKPVAKANSEVTAISATGSRAISSNLSISRPQRWDMDRPYLYTLVTEVLDKNRVVDKYTTTFGVRTIAFDKDRGFLLNGYSKYYDEWSERDVGDMIRRDRNHPSIILWSIGNEIPEQKSADGWKEAKRLTGLFHEEDPTRPTTSAFNDWDDAIRNHLADNVDIPGFNYKPMRYEQIMKEHPTWVIVGSETASCVSSRGVYHLPIVKYEKDPSWQISSYDIISPSWAYCPDVEFTYQDKFPNVLGEFVWTGFDYIGEPTPYFDWRGNKDPRDWPARSSYFGMVDLAGFPKDRYYLYQSQWTSKPMVHILPHWNWTGHEGKNIPVMAYTNAEAVELFLNGKSLGKKGRFSEPVDIPVGSNVSPDKNFYTKYRLLWQVPYEPGTLKAIAYSSGKEVAAEEVHTAGAPAKIALAPDRKVIHADGDDLSFVTVRIEDKDGNLCPSADNLVHFGVTGAGEIQAVDNGNAATVEPFHADHRTAFSGLALLIVRSQNRPGKIQVVATSDGLSQGEVEIDTAPIGSQNETELAHLK